MAAVATGGLEAVDALLKLKDAAPGRALKPLGVLHVDLHTQISTGSPLESTRPEFKKAHLNNIAQVDIKIVLGS